MFYIVQKQRRVGHGVGRYHMPARQNSHEREGE